MDILNPHIGLIFWTTVSFLILLIILKKYAWIPIISYIHNREQFIQDSLLKAKEAQNEIKQLNDNKNQLIKEACLEKDKIIKNAYNISDSIIEEANKKSHIKFIAMIEKAKKEIDIYENHSMENLKNKVSDLSIVISKNIIKNVLKNEEDQIILIEKIIANRNFN
ncbi:MAG: F0F1 ATP synthase subunit B [Bacteroides sp.]|nr:MAG: F0F1 ATP synthase subunit B [Bacteroides sp.]